MAERRPLRVLDATAPLDLVPDITDRLAELLDRYHLAPTAEGWRDLAVLLALKHEPEFRVETPYDPDEGRGRPTDSRRWTWRIAVRNRAKRLGSFKAAADAVRREFKDHPALPSAKTLQNIAADGAPFPSEIRQRICKSKAESAAMIAAVSMSKSSPD